MKTLNVTFCFLIHKEFLCSFDNYAVLLFDIQLEAQMDPAENFCSL